MATVRPFKGLRPLSHYAAQVASKPYDVLTSDEAREEAAGNPLSFLHVGKPEIDLPPGINPYDVQVYHRGNANLRRLIADGILRQDQSPCLYVYSQAMGSHSQHGVVGCVPVREYLDGTIRKHELTRPDKEDDRARHIDATNAHTGPIFLAYRAQRAIDTQVEQLCLTSPEYDFHAGDGVRHRLRVIKDVPTIQVLTDLFKGVQNLYIADGHHRAAAAARVAQQRTAKNNHLTGMEEYNFILAVLFPHTQLQIMGYNRLVRDLNGKDPDGFLEEVKKVFEVNTSATQVRPSKKGEFGMYVHGQWYTLTAPDHLLKSTDPIGRLDVSILQTHLLSPLLGIQDPRTDTRIDFVGGIRGLGELERRVRSGEMAVAFSLHPTSIDELFVAADAGQTMPPKSTWFEPKLRDGVVVHLLD